MPMEFIVPSLHVATNITDLLDSGVVEEIFS
jgi:hypothetical protein